ncbi:MAG: hypothetical protein ABL993_01215 [Vicinamibacterales bacterium]
MRRTWAAAGAYLAVAVFATWPLASGLSSDVAWDLGDPLLSMWILSWDCRQMLAILGGDLSRIAHFFDGNLFYPASLTLAFSEHFIAQAIQVLPVYFLTENPILCYNLLFLSTFVLSGVGAYQLVRELTGDWRAAFLSGLLFAFAPYRFPQSSHLQVLSSQWMPFALYGFTRYFATRSRRALAGGAGALLAQNLSCGYYLLFFTPFAAMYILWEVLRRGVWRDRRLWTEIATAGLVVAAATAVFFLPYLQAREAMPMTRGVEEATKYSADVFSYFTAFDSQSIWGSVAHALPKDEGHLFPGAVPMLLAAIGFGLWVSGAWRVGRSTASPRPRLEVMLIGLALTSLIAAIVAIFLRRFTVDVGVAELRVSSIGRALAWFAVLIALASALSPRVRVRLRALISPSGFFCLALVAAWWLSLGPRPSNMRVPIELPAPYAVLHEYVPGFEGLRVPARYAMVGALMMAVVSGYAVAALAGRRILATVITGMLAVAFVTEAHVTTFTINGQGGGRGYALPEGRVYPPARAPLVYARVAALPAGAVLLEVPLGDPDWDVRAVYYAATHWRPLVNGYSGFFPPSYALLTLALTDPDRDGDLSWSVLQASGATHVIVHERAFRQPEAEQLTLWLRNRRAIELFRDGTDVLYAMPR